MKKKRGAGGKDQPYDPKTGEFLGNNRKKETLSKIKRTLESDLVSRKRHDATRMEFRAWYDAIGEIKQGVRFEVESNGKTFIPIGNKIFVTIGTYEEPELERIIEFDSMEELDEFIKELEDDVW